MIVAFMVILLLFWCFTIWYCYKVYYFEGKDFETIPDPGLCAALAFW